MVALDGSDDSARDECNFRESIDRVKAPGGSEMSNCQLFIEKLSQALVLPQPDIAAEQNRFNDYVYERWVDFKHADGSTNPGRIDLYRRGCFILEAKQPSKRNAPPLTSLGLEGIENQRKRGPAKPGEAIRKNNKIN